MCIYISNSIYICIYIYVYIGTCIFSTQTMYFLGDNLIDFLLAPYQVIEKKEPVFNNHWKNTKKQKTPKESWLKPKQKHRKNNNKPNIFTTMEGSAPYLMEPSPPLL